MSNIFLSVIIPVYNTEKYFDKCITSAVNAVYKLGLKSEIIVIDDGSPGNIKSIIREYLIMYPEIIKFISQENKGRGAVRNLGISEARGKYISFIDSDDYIDDNMYLEMLLDFKDDDIDVFICDIENIDLNNQKNNFTIKTKNSDIFDERWTYFDNMIMPSCCNKVIKKDLFDGICFPENINYEDLATIPAIMLNVNKIKYVPCAFYKYIQNLDSVMHEEFSAAQLNLIDALNIVFSRIEALNNISSDDAKKAEYMLYTRRYYEEILEKIALSSNNGELISVFLNKSKELEKKAYDNIYLKKLIRKHGIIKSVSNKILHNAVQSSNFKLLSKFLTRNVYYRFIAIRYKSIE